LGHLAHRGEKEVRNPRSGKHWTHSVRRGKRSREGFRRRERHVSGEASKQSRFAKIRGQEKGVKDATIAVETGTIQRADGGGH